MQMSLSLKQSAEKLGISFSHYDINGHLIDASPTSIDYFIEQFSSPPDASLRYQLLDEQNQIQFEKTIPYSTALLLPALSFIYYRLMLFIAQQTRKYYRL